VTVALNEFRFPKLASLTKRYHRQYIFRWSIRFSRKGELSSLESFLSSARSSSPTGKPGQPPILCCATAIFVVACVRGIIMRAYLRTRASVATSEIARRWEYRYGAGASVILALMGFWCYIAFSRAFDSFVHLVS
jgi:hypothetical protein